LPVCEIGVARFFVEAIFKKIEKPLFLFLKT